MGDGVLRMGWCPDKKRQDRECPLLLLLSAMGERDHEETPHQELHLPAL